MIIHNKQKNPDIIIKTEIYSNVQEKPVNDDKQILSTKLSIDDYNVFLTLTKLEYQAGLIKEECTSELEIYNYC